MAMDFGTSVGAAILKDLMYAAMRQVRYSFCFSSFVEDVEKEKQKLILTRKNMLDKTEKAKKKTEKIATDVEQWLNDASILLAEVEMLEEKIETKKSCFLGQCPNWIWQYRLGKEAAKKTNTIKKLNTNSEFKQFSRLATLPGLKYYSSEGFIYFESTKSTYDHILNALKDDDIHMIGVYGMGGTGKTALVKEVGKEAEQLFDKVVFLAVSSTIDVRRIQGKIATSLGFELKEEYISERAKRLYMRLTSGESILIILDDVWQMLDFEAIGIPFGENHMGCNILLTTRSLQVCAMMHCQRMIPLSLITEEEAWALFQKHAGIADNASEDLKHLAQEITNECKGLPVAIKAVASTLKGRNLVEWEEALETLRDSRLLDIEQGLENPYKCLQLSYDNLKNEEAKSLFLLCALFPEDSEIPLEILIRFGFGLGLFEGVNSFKRARGKVGATINKLINFGLLIQVEERSSVVMHDLVRDVALWIAKKEIQVIMGPKMDTKALIEDKSIKGSIRFLYCHNINEFPDELDCPNLEILYVYKDGKGSFQAPNSLFKGMKELKILTLHYHILSKGSLLLPQSIYCLTNLRTLCLRGCRLDNASFLGNLERLETLEFCKCVINELPNDTAELRKLRLLDVSLCSVGGNPYEVLGRCSQLEELYFIKNDLPERVLNDQNLTKFFRKNSSSHRLQRYHLDIGSYNYKFKGDLRAKFLSLNHFDVSTSSAVIKDLIQRAEILFLRNIKGGCKNIIPDMFHVEGGSTNDLVELHLDSSEEMECLIDTTNLFPVGIIFSNLVKLRITWMKRLKALCRGPPPLGLFEKLEELRLAQCSQLHSVLVFEKLNLQSLKILKFENCPMLASSLFSPAVARSLEQLEVLKIRHCNGLKHIMTSDEAEIVLDDNGELSYRLLFKKLKRLMVKWCGQLESLIPVSFSKGLVQLECLEIDKSPELRHVFQQDQLSFQNQNELHIIELPVLKLLKLLHLPNIINICPEGYHPMWPSLQNLYLLQCPQLNIMSVNNSIGGLMSRQGDTEELMPLVIHSSQVIDGVSPLLTLQNVERLVVGYCKIEGIFQLSGLPINRVLDPLTSCLYQLSLDNLPELSYIFRGPSQVLNLPNLVELCVHRCRKLKSIFSACIAGSLPHLEVLDIKYCDQLEQIIEDEERENHLNHCGEPNELEIIRTSPPLQDLSTQAHKSTGPLNLHNLKQMKLASCPMLRSLFTPSTAKTLRSLQYLSIEECHGLKFVVTEEAVQESNREEMVNEDHEGKCFVLFPKLEVLRVEKCDLLEYIFPVSYAQGLLELKNMVICKTPRVKYIFGESHDEEHSSNKNKKQIQIQLPFLTELCLRGLPNIISICPERFYVSCLSLRRFSLDSLGLPNMSANNLMISSKAAQWGYTSSQESLEVQDLQTIENSGKLSLCNCKIEAIFQIEGPTINGDQDPLVLSLSYLDLHNLPELRHIWKGPQQLLNLENLIELSVVECQKLKFIFSSFVLRSLPQLMSLTMKHCELLVQIIEEDEVDANHLARHCQHVCFPKLEILDIQQCSNLKCLFSISTPHELPQLRYLFIEDCSLLEKVFVGEECEIGQEEALMFPNLECLRLRKLPNLTDIFKGFKLKFVYHEVEDCPKLASAAAAALKFLPQGHQYPGQVSKEEGKRIKGKEKLLMEEAHVIDLTKSYAERREVHVGQASSTPFVDLQKEPGDYIHGLENDSKTKHSHEDYNCGVAASVVFIHQMSVVEAPQHLSTSVPVSLNVHDPSPAVIQDSAATNSSPLTPPSAQVSSGSVPPVHVSPVEVNPLDSSSRTIVMTPIEEYAAFRDIGAIKKRHIPLLEKAIMSYPSLWSWREKFMRPKMREFGYNSLGDMLEFLTLTRWRDLTETKKAEFESLICELEAFGFDMQWLRNTETMVKQRKIDQETIDRMKTLEVQVKEQESVVQDLEVRLQMAKIELANMKSELENVRCEVGDLDNFIGF